MEISLKYTPNGIIIQELFINFSIRKLKKQE